MIQGQERKCLHEHPTEGIKQSMGPHSIVSWRKNSGELNVVVMKTFGQSVALPPKEKICHFQHGFQLRHKQVNTR